MVVHDVAARPDRSFRRLARRASELALGQIVRAASQFIGVIILSRMLGPSIAGTGALIIALLTFGDLLRDAGLSAASLSLRCPSRQTLSALFRLQLLAATLVALTFAFVGPLLPPALGGSLPPQIFAAGGLVFLLNGAGAQHRTELIRTGRTTRVAAADTIASILSLLAAIISASIGLGYWTFVIQYAAFAFVSACAVFIFGAWLPSHATYTDEVRAVLRLGIELATSQSIGYLGNNVDTLALSGLSTPAQLGFYSRAFQFGIAPAALLQNPLSNATVAHIASFPPGDPRVSATVLDAQYALGVTLLPIAAVIGAAAEPLTRILLGNAWIPVTHPLRVLVIASALQQLGNPASWAALVSGKGKLLIILTTIGAIVRVAILVPLASHGATFVAYGYSASALMLLPLALVIATWGAQVTPRTLWRQTFILFGTFLGAVAFGSLLSSRVHSPAVSLAVAFLAVMATYSLLLFDRRLRIRALSLFRIRVSPPTSA